MGEPTTPNDPDRGAEARALVTGLILLVVMVGGLFAAVALLD